VGAVIVTVAVMVVYLTGPVAPYVGAAAVISFPSLAKCEESIPVVLRQPTVSAAFCVDTTRILKG
jgi:hypothetical protein